MDAIQGNVSVNIANMLLIHDRDVILLFSEYDIWVILLPAGHYFLLFYSDKTLMSSTNMALEYRNHNVSYEDC